MTSHPGVVIANRHGVIPVVSRQGHGNRILKRVSRTGRETSFFGWCWGLQYRLVATDRS